MSLLHYMILPYANFFQSRNRLPVTKSTHAHGFIMLPPRHPRVLARVTRWQQALHYITLQALHYITLQALHYITLHYKLYITLHYITSSTLHYITSSTLKITYIGCFPLCQRFPKFRLEFKWKKLNRELTLKCKLKCYLNP